MLEREKKIPDEFKELAKDFSEKGFITTSSQNLINHGFYFLTEGKIDFWDALEALQSWRSWKRLRGIFKALGGFFRAPGGI